jgi:hypothetical protein
MFQVSQERLRFWEHKIVECHKMVPLGAHFHFQDLHIVSRSCAVEQLDETIVVCETFLHSMTCS